MTVKLRLTKVLLCTAILAYGFSLEARQARPKILVKDSDKAAILEKIENQQWAKAIFERTKSEVEPYVQRHVNDPEWILSRYLMNRGEGKKYTDFVANEKQITKFEGNATIPTVRVAQHIRNPIGYRVPKIEELTPYDTCVVKMMLPNSTTGKFEMADPQRMIENINGAFNSLAMKASILYWLTGDERYAKFSADILDQWARGAAQQNPIHGPGRAGYLCHQTLGDSDVAKTMAYAFDFLGDYLQTHGYELSCYDNVFEKLASTLAYKGYSSNNWYAAESSGLVAAALALEDPQKCEKYIQYYTVKDTVKNGIGQLAIPSTMKIWFNEDGHWREPGGYHSYPTNNLLEAAIMAENNGHDIIKKYPALLKSTYAMVTYSFPNLTAAGYGDTGRARQSSSLLEIGLVLAHKYGMDVENDLLSVMQVMEKNGYDRSKGSITDMLINLPEIPKKEVPPFRFNRSEWLDFASASYQRNGMDEKNGLMYVVHGDTYNHNHRNGMAMELYGKGSVSGADSGNGKNYDSEDHVQYYTAWAAHNTVVAAGASSCPEKYSGGGGTKQIGSIEFVAMEPKAKQKALSENMQFTDSKYLEKTTGTNQRRTMAIVRTAPDAGYYVDIFRSDNTISNDYVYHNEGETLTLCNQSGSDIKMNPTTYPVRGEDLPGLRFFTEATTTGPCTEPVMARFTAAKAVGGMRVMNVWMPASTGKSYYVANAPAIHTAQAPYTNEISRVLTIRTEGPKAAWNDPFIAIFEPSDSETSHIRNVSRKLGKQSVVIDVVRDSGHERIFNSCGTNPIKHNGATFVGDFAVVSVRPGEVEYYIGDGTVLSVPADPSLGTTSPIKIEAEKSGESFSASVLVTGGKLRVNSSQKLKISQKK